ncbi:MAG TPA: 50S ribosomal protein L15 [Candidatus Marinimicrobia bacterium]|nr:50S ribosomal protein L15 [Candidatus Neomarinimicrobiota bacterium]HRS52160.1 50S ribosomal protein L15 [Candidatus Neomarinimicrobiota bacterium]HRU92463.1 50S ribosomal protein L15 [Candidatus Neomarinimicrobiota bacterium]
MGLNTLKPACGSVKDKKRLGRGVGSGHGGTAGRGNKGTGSRGSNKKPNYFEGGQMPIYRHLPKRGFKNLFKEEFQVVNLDHIARLQITEVNPEILQQKGLIKNLKKPIKILGRGEVSSAITVFAHAFSALAKEKITASGGKAELL